MAAKKTQKPAVKKPTEKKVNSTPASKPKPMAEKKQESAGDKVKTASKPEPEKKKNWLKKLLKRDEKEKK